MPANIFKQPNIYKVYVNNHYSFVRTCDGGCICGGGTLKFNCDGGGGCKNSIMLAQFPSFIQLFRFIITALRQYFTLECVLSTGQFFLFTQIEK